MKNIIAFILMLTLAAAVPQARKIAYRHSVKDSKQENMEEMTAGSFMVASQCEDCNNGYTLQQIRFTGFDKPQGSDTESFFITNETNRTMTAVTLYIEYLTPDGRQLHKKFLRLSCDIPPGETRKADIRSWDRQNSFYFIKSRPGRNPGNPFDVRFDPIAYYLRF